MCELLRVDARIPPYPIEMNRKAFPLLPLVLTAALTVTARAQDSTRTTKDTLSPPRQAAPPAANSQKLDFSGVLFLNFQTGGNAAERRAQQNRFDVERAYLTFRALAGARTSIRVTTDVYQQRDPARDEFYRGWAIRAKYAYAQYELVRPTEGVGGYGTVARFGLIQTPVVDYEEQFWLRGLAQTAPDANGYFASADVGLASAWTLPGKAGELYLAVLNGSGYTSRETDRFKDFGGRLSITPFNRSTRWFRSFAVAPWFYKGTRASDFVDGRGSIRPVSTGRQKDRYGVHVGLRDARVTAGTQFGWRVDDIESAVDTVTATAPTVASTRGTLLSTYATVRPLAFNEAGPHWPVSVVFRFDRVNQGQGTAGFTQFVIAGVGYDLSSRASIWVDYQNQDPRNGSSAPDLKTLFVHGIIGF